MIRGREEEVKMGKVREGKERGRKEGREGGALYPQRDQRQLKCTY